MLPLTNFYFRNVGGATHILKYRIRNEWWKRQISNKNLFICKNVFTLALGGFWLVRKRVDANNEIWRRICRINSSMRNKKWLCAMGRQNLTNQLTDLVPQHLKCCYGHSEMPEQSHQSISSKYFCIIASQNCLTRLCCQTAGIRFWK